MSTVSYVYPVRVELNCLKLTEILVVKEVRVLDLAVHNKNKT